MEKLNVGKLSSRAPSCLLLRFLRSWSFASFSSALLAKWPFRSRRSKAVTMTVLGRVPFYQSRKPKTNRGDFTAVKPRDNSVFHDFQYIARFVSLGSILHRPLVEGRSKNHLGRVCRATKLLYDTTIPISRHKVVFFLNVANANFKVATITQLRSSSHY